MLEHKLLKLIRPNLDRHLILVDNTTQCVDAVDVKIETKSIPTHMGTFYTHIARVVLCCAVLFCIVLNCKQELNSTFTSNERAHRINIEFSSLRAQNSDNKSVSIIIIKH